MLFLLASNATAMLGAAILTALFVFLDRRFGHRFLKLWSLSFAAATGYLLFSLVGLAMVSHGVAAPHPARLAASLAAQSLAFLQLFLLLAGVWEFTGGHALSTAILRRGVVLMLLLGLISTLAYAFDPAAEAQRVLLRVGLRYLATASAFGLAAALVWCRLHASDRSTARWVASAFFVYACAQLLILGIFSWQFVTGTVSPAGRLFGLVELLFQTLLGGMLAMWLLDRERRRALLAQERIHTLEHYDAVTGLPNRAHFSALAADRTATGQAQRLWLLDLAGLRPIQQLAASYPDRLLQLLAQRLRTELGETALFGRLRADVLAALLPLAPDAESAAAHGARLHAALRQPLWLDGRALLPPMRLGSADFPSDADDAAVLLALAERTLAQAEGEDTPVLPAAAARRGATLPLADLHHAVVQGDLELYYQPILRSDGQVLALEALLRWKLADGRLLSPEDFLSAMRQSSFTAALDARVLEMALGQLASWQQQPALVKLKLAVNLAPASLLESQFAARLLKQLATLGIHPESLELEITETAALHRPAEVLHTLELLRAGGVDLSLDDFGTGYSALAHLRALPVQRIKLDRSFVAGLPDQARDVAIVEALVALAHALGLAVTAEGVERPGQHDFLKQLGVDAQQGFLHARPLPAAAVPDWLARQARVAAPA